MNLCSLNIQTAKTQSTHEAEENIFRLRVRYICTELLTYQAVESFIAHLKDRRQQTIKFKYGG